MPSLTVYSLPDCPQCEALKTTLKRLGAEFREEDMSSAESLTERRVNGVFVKEAPVLRCGDRFFTTRDLFSGGRVAEEHLLSLCGGS